MLVAPLDVLKIRFQLQVEPVSRAAAAAAAAAAAPSAAPPRPAPPHGPPHYTGMLQALPLLLREEGLRTLWRGNGAAMALWVGFAAVQFPVYHAATAALRRAAGWGIGSGAHGRAADAGVSLAAGAAAGAAATVATYPLDWLRTRWAGQGVPRHFNTTAELVAATLATRGPAGLFQGLAPTLLQVVPGVGLTFAVNEQLRTAYDSALEAAARRQRLRADGSKLLSLPPLQSSPKLTHHGTDTEGVGGCIADGGAGAPPVLPARPSPTSLGTSASVLASPAVRAAVCGAAAGAAVKLATYPLDTVKRRAQAAGMARAGVYGRPHAPVFRGTLPTLAEIAVEEGVVRGLYKGTAPSLLKSALGAAATFAVYDSAAGALLASGGAWARRDGTQ